MLHLKIMLEVLGHYHPTHSLADLHIHTKGSDGLLQPEQVVEQAVAQRLQAIAVTDHEVIDFAIRAQDYARAKDYNLEVVVGSELTTAHGHLLGLFMLKNIPTGKSTEWTIQEIHDQQGLAIAPHPFYSWTRSLGREKIFAIMNNSHPEIYFDGFEVFNGGVYDNPHTRANQNALDFYLRHQEQLGAAMGSTDTHYYTIGRGLTAYRNNLRLAILGKKTSVLHLDQREQINLFLFAQQQYAGLVLEPGRRLHRFAQKRWREYILCLGSV